MRLLQVNPDNLFNLFYLDKHCNQDNLANLSNLVNQDNPVNLSNLVNQEELWVRNIQLLLL
jgi:hypothetical protein